MITTVLYPRKKKGEKTQHVSFCWFCSLGLCFLDTCYMCWCPSCQCSAYKVMFWILLNHSPPSAINHLLFANHTFGRIVFSDEANLQREKRAHYLLSFLSDETILNLLIRDCFIWRSFSRHSRWWVGLVIFPVWDTLYS